MKAVVLYGPKNVALGDLPAARLKDDEIRISVAYCGICGSDHHKVAGKKNTHPVTYPVALGHEISGVIVEMGSGVNIGAGSITCNYDGVFKHRTTIGNDVFVGSDTMMVAPVALGDGALVGASSCITQDVPAGALAVERSEQVMIEGYATVRMKRLREQKAASEKE